MKKNIVRIVVALVLFITLFFVHAEPIYSIISLVTYLIIGYDVLINAFKNVLKGKMLDENFLMTIATIGAIAIGELHEAIAVMLFYQVGENFQAYAVNKARRSVEELSKIRPDYANKLLPDGTTERCDPYDIAIGDTIQILPSERVPLDCTIISGSSNIDVSAITGESVPVAVNTGQELLSGSINLSGVITAEVIREFSESTVSKILELVESSYEKKAKTEKFITKFSKIYTPSVVAAAGIMLIVQPMLGLADITTAIYHAISFLVISCPCALVISVPMAFFGGIGAASKNGILIKGSGYIEQLAKLERCVFDKTGTITHGVFEVNSILPSEGTTSEELIALAASAEFASHHPIATSLKNAYNKEPLSVSDINEITGKGISCILDGKTLLVGNDKLLKDNAINITTDGTGYGTKVYVALDNVYKGVITISDTIKETAKSAIQELHDLGVKSCIMLSGDNSSAVDYVSKAVGIDTAYSELLPHEKLEKLEGLLSDKFSVAYTGDGTNDAPVLARADIGIAMGIISTDAAVEAADVIINNDDLEKLPLAIKIARKTIKIVIQNIVFAISVKLIVLVLSAIGIVGPWWAIFADVGVSALAIMNSLRALMIKS